MIESWTFFAIRAAKPSGFTWQWQKRDDRVLVTSEPFDFYFDCVFNARNKGYAGALPAGPRVPLDQLPKATVRTKRISAAVPPAIHSRPRAMTTTPISTVGVPKRRPRAASAVG
jgi:hypothetical protein